MGRKQMEKTKAALALVGTIREDGKPHTRYSAARLMGVSPGALYKTKKANLASSSNDGVSGESQ